MLVVCELRLSQGAIAFEACARRPVFRGSRRVVDVRFTPKALTLMEHCMASSTVQPNVRGNLPVEAGADWPRKENWCLRLERPDGACRSGSG